MKTTEFPELTDSRINKIATMLIGVWVRKDNNTLTNALLGNKFNLGVEKSHEVFQRIIAPAMIGLRPELPELLDEDDPGHEKGVSTILVELVRIRGVTLDANFINFVRNEAGDLPMVDWLELLAFYHQVVISPIIQNYSTLYRQFKERDEEG